MIRALSFIIACILTILLALALYPIAIIFWAISRIGDAVGFFSKWVFTLANRAIKYLWSDLKRENGFPVPENIPATEDDNNQQ